MEDSAVNGWEKSCAAEKELPRERDRNVLERPRRRRSVLQVRAAELSDDDRLSRHIHTRSGSPFTRRPKSPNLKRPPADKQRKS